MKAKHTSLVASTVICLVGIGLLAPCHAQVPTDSLRYEQVRVVGTLTPDSTAHGDEQVPTPDVTKVLVVATVQEPSGQVPDAGSEDVIQGQVIIVGTIASDQGNDGGFPQPSGETSNTVSVMVIATFPGSASSVQEVTWGIVKDLVRTNHP